MIIPLRGIGGLRHRLGLQALAKARKPKRRGWRRRVHVVGRAGNVKRVRIVWAERLQTLDDGAFIRRYRLCKEEFAQLVVWLRPALQGIRSTRLSVELQVSIALRLLAGGSHLDVADLHGVAEGTAEKTLDRVVKAVDELVQLPFNEPADLRNVELLDEISAGFAEHTDGAVFGCVGAIDGIHVRITKPAEDGPSYMCRKGFFSINCQAIVDSKRRFLWVEAGARGPVHDCTAFLDTEFASAIDEGHLPSQYFFYGDDAYKAIGHQIVTPYPGRGLWKSAPDQDNANFWISRSRIEVECSFGELVARWGILWRPLTCTVKKASKIFVVCCKLNNLCKSEFKAAATTAVADLADFDGDGRRDPFFTDIFPYDMDVASARVEEVNDMLLVVQRHDARRDAISARLKENGLVRPAHSVPLE